MSCVPFECTQSPHRRPNYKWCHAVLCMSAGAGAQGAGAQDAVSYAPSGVHPVSPQKLANSYLWAAGLGLNAPTSQVSSPGVRCFLATLQHGSHPEADPGWAAWDHSILRLLLISSSHLLMRAVHQDTLASTTPRICSGSVGQVVHATKQCLWAQVGRQQGPPS